MDEDGDGSITIDELKKALSTNTDAKTDENIEQVMKMADVDGDGVLSKLYLNNKTNYNNEQPKK